MSDATFKCFVCGLEVDNSMRLELHLNTHSSVRMFECTLCKMAYPQENLLRHHTALAHPEAGEFMRCPLCPELFTSQQKADAHKRLHSTTRCPFCPAVPLDQMAPCTLYLHSHINSIHRDHVPTLLRKFGLLEGLEAGHTASDIADIMAKRGLTGDYKLKPDLIPLLCAPCDVFTANKFTKTLLVKMFAPRRSSALAEDIDTYFGLTGSTTVKLRNIDLFQLYRIVPCCGRQFDTLGRYNRHVKICMPEVYKHLMITSITLVTPGYISYNMLKSKAAGKKGQPGTSQQSKDKSRASASVVAVCPVCSKEFNATSAMIAHMKRLHPDAQTPKRKQAKKVIKI